jgi:hypothetical protein
VKFVVTLTKGEDGYVVAESLGFPAASLKERPGKRPSKTSEKPSS